MVWSNGLAAMFTVHGHSFLWLGKLKTLALEPTSESQWDNEQIVKGLAVDFVN